MDEKEKALHYFRNLVYCIYREIRVFRQSICDELYGKINSESGFFHIEKGKEIAENLYHAGIIQCKTSAIIAPYKKITGLTICNLKTIYEKGNWGFKPVFGGMRWAIITQKTIELKKAIDHEEWQRIPNLLCEIDELYHNTRKVIHKFHSYPFMLE